jgi:hypothetical protein
MTEIEMFDDLFCKPLWLGGADEQASRESVKAGEAIPHARVNRTVEQPILLIMRAVEANCLLHVLVGSDQLRK